MFPAPEPGLYPIPMPPAVPEAMFPVRAAGVPVTVPLT